MSRRIAITGLGVLSPIGIGHRRFWQQLTAGTIGTGDIKKFDTSIFDFHKGGEVDHFEPEDYFRVLDPMRCGRTTQLAVAAARLASDDSGFDHSGYDSERVSICMGTTMGNQSVIEDHNDHVTKGHTPLNPESVSHYSPVYITSAIAREIGAGGPSMVFPTACAAGNYAIGWGADLIKDGQADIAIVGGADAISRGCFAVFHRLGAIAPDVCQPFDANRKGMMVSEGAGAIVLEDYDAAVKRGATIYAELLGYGLACDAHHPTAPHPKGLGAQWAMRRALAEANLDEMEISYISAHGTGTRANDSSESFSVRNLLGDNADRIPVSSIKSMLGHTMGAASAIEAVACTLAIYYSVLPPTMNYQEPDLECLQNVVPNKAVSHPVNIALSNSFAFGGNISTIIMGSV
ncbi:beta-ketoacyl-[acyl-carrier-protein] synthase family protein [Kroppenstedtia pulmonis]|uniref:Beta-ketoacyl-[acyl-carrier-protein] synthase family protein n=1 Tax=Kroppenstedtia pulmonis TaxID=1380685 RepID=A0A7D4CJT7_9BACL|nr:beta-ketoacyl-[acyl-carrier-protein] synthase family protein [Kroppenstedtia pulmonis]QKG83258.1 beta-ketoacyl-[acyl-carrier-protein] synthase family protein [Kroppenstedtia pulmonis]